MYFVVDPLALAVKAAIPVISRDDRATDLQCVHVVPGNAGLAIKFMPLLE